jgi:hypothetical protein
MIVERDDGVKCLEEMGAKCVTPGWWHDDGAMRRQSRPAKRKMADNAENGGTRGKAQRRACMGEFGLGYGSECHLLRWMGRHRNELDRRILSAIGSTGQLQWLDFGFSCPDARPLPDAELTGLEFLKDSNPAKGEWRRIWPHSGSQHHWDAVAWLHTEHGSELVLVEAKAPRNPSSTVMVGEGFSKAATGLVAISSSRSS